MARVRVPKGHRPPSRFEPFRDPGAVHEKDQSLYRCSGSYRIPKIGELYWSYFLECVVVSSVISLGPRVILERVK